MTWIVEFKDNPELSRRGELLNQQVHSYRKRGFPIDPDVFAARITLENYVHTWLTECRLANRPRKMACAGFFQAWKSFFQAWESFVDENIAAEDAHRRRPSSRRSVAGCDSPLRQARRPGCWLRNDEKPRLARPEVPDAKPC